MSTQAETVLLPPRFRGVRVSIRLGDFPLIPTLILVGHRFCRDLRQCAGAA